MLSSVTCLHFGAPEEPCESRSLDEAIGEFLVGSENRWLEALYETAGQWKARHVPVLLTGPSGTGKTHFARGLAQRYSLRFPTSSVVQCSSADFMRAWNGAMEVDSLPDFHQRFRGADFLFLDDIEELRDKTAAQIELLHTLDERCRMSRHTVITTRRTLSDLRFFHPGLSSRLQGGLTVPIVHPGTETREAILKHFAQRDHIDLSDTALEWVQAAAEQNGFGCSVRQLRGLMLQRASHNASGAEQHRSALADLPTATRPLTVKRIVRTVANYFDCRIRDLTGPSRRKNLVRYRAIAVYLTRKHTGCSYQSIGRELGNRDHSTIMHAYQQISDQLEEDDQLRMTIERIGYRLAEDA